LLFSSIFFLFAGFLGQAFSWKKTLQHSNCHVDYKKSIASIGLTIFGKYVPGKVWMLVGRSTYVSLKKNSELWQTTVISLVAQLIALWTGLILGIFGIIALKGFYYWGSFPTIIFLLVLTLIILSPFLNKFTMKIYKFFYKKEIFLFMPSLKEIFFLIPWFLIYWIFWTIGFYLLIISFTTVNPSILAALGFPLASTIGIAAIFAPGGLGVRESIMAGYMVLSGLAVHEATSIAIVARLWFLIGEIFIFLLALSVHYKDRHRKTYKTVT